MGFADAVVSFAKAYNAATGRGRIERCCEQLGWGIDGRDGDKITLNFKCPVVGTRPVFIRGGDEPLVIFATYSLAILSEEDVPDELGSALLLRNSQLALPKWQLEEGKNGKAFFCLEYTALGAGLDAAAVKYICQKMAEEASDIDARMKRAGLLR